MTNNFSEIVVLSIVFMILKLQMLLSNSVLDYSVFPETINKVKSNNKIKNQV